MINMQGLGHMDALSSLAQTRVQNQTPPQVGQLHEVVTASAADIIGGTGGIVSNLLIGATRNLLGSTKVYSSGPSQTGLLQPSHQMAGQMPGMTMQPSQVKTQILG